MMYKVCNVVKKTLISRNFCMKNGESKIPQFPHSEMATYNSLIIIFTEKLHFFSPQTQNTDLTAMRDQ